MRRDIWERLGTEPTHDVVAIKRAYAARLKSTRPDDDAEAYQQLREAYELALQAARDAAVVVDASPDCMLPPLRSPRDAFVPGEPELAWLRDDTLAALVDQAGKLDGREFAVQWPRIEATLGNVPLAQRDAASREFAELALASPAWPAEALAQVADHFGWGIDFRADAALGPALAERLRAWLREKGARRVIGAVARHRFAVPLKVDRLLEAGRDNLAMLYAALAPPKFGDRLRDASPMELRGLGLGLGGLSPEDVLAARTLSATFAMAAGWRMACFALLLAALLHFAFEVPGVPAIAAGALIVSASALVSIASRRLREVFDAAAAYLDRLDPGTRAMTAYVALLVGTALQLTQERLVFAVLASMLAFVVAWDLRKPWRAMVLPVTVAASAALAALFTPPFRPFAVILGTAWVLCVQMAVPSRDSAGMRILQHPRCLVPGSARQALRLAVALPFATPYLLVILVIGLPAVYLVFALLHGTAFAVAGLALAATASWMTFDSSPLLIPVWFVCAPFALGALQWIATGLSRLPVFRSQG